MKTIDDELFDLLRDRPELIRVAETIAVTQPRVRRRTRRFVLACALVAAGIAIGLVTTWPGGGPNVVDRALAAIGTGPVVHAVVEYSRPSDVVVDLATGKTRERVHQTEYWYDAERSLLHTRLLTDGEMLTEIVETPNGSDSDLGHYPGGIAAQLDPALAGFVTRYRDALANGTATIVGHDQVDGHDVTLLRIALAHGETEDVAVDSSSYRPLFFKVNPRPSVSVAGQIPTWHVAVIESLAREPSFFAKPARSQPRPTGGSGESNVEELTPDEAAEALERPALWVGPRFAEAPLTRIEQSQLRVDYTDGTSHDGAFLRLAYGPSFVIAEATSVAGSYQLGFNDGGDPPAPAGSIVLEDNSIFRGSPRAQWTGKLIVDGMYVQINASSRELVLAAARALRPLR